MANELLTNQHQLRVELLKVVYRHDRSADDAVVRAKSLEQYVTGDDAKAPSSDGQGEPDAPI